MTIQDLMDRAMLVTGLSIGNEAVFYYNEVIDYLLNRYPKKITVPHCDTVEVRTNEERHFSIPASWASVLSVRNQYGKRIFCENTSDTLVLPYSGVFQISYTKKPVFAKALNEALEHNRIFDICIPYYFAWKMCERDQLSANRIQKFRELFEEYLSSAVKSHARQGLKYIKSQPL